MSEYWKSQPKKHCDFCKCWIADNRASVDFHENGKRHKENVQKKLGELRRKGLEDAEKEQAMEESLKAMEKAAMESLKKDLSRNPAMASQYGVIIKSKKDQAKEEKPTETKVAAASSTDKPGTTEPSGAPEKEEGDWYEAQSDQGYTYYWNTVTLESVWVAPVKYISLAQQQGQGTGNEVKNTEKQGLERVDRSKDAEPSSSESADEKEDAVSDNEDEVKDEESEPPPPGVIDVSCIPLPGAMDSTSRIPTPGQPASLSDQDPSVPSSIPLPGDNSHGPHNGSSGNTPPRNTKPQRKRPSGAYGGWETVEQEQEEMVDLQLPQTEQPQEAVLPEEPEIPRIKFREKKVDTLGKEFIAFKKRKMGGGSKNLRQKKQ